MDQEIYYEDNWPPLASEWKSLLKAEFREDYFKNIFQQLENENKNNHTVFPPFQLIFNAFNSTLPAHLKVVIIGQDPYHGPGQAHGLCFSVQKPVKPPPSLVNIYKELKTDLGLPIPDHGELSSWANQGVLLLNATLTVRAHQAGSHQSFGWETFTNHAIESISKNSDSLVFMLWGRFAQSKSSLIDQNKHFILEAAHPSPFSATKFFGCRHFSRCNEILKSLGKEPVNWQII